IVKKWKSPVSSRRLTSIALPYQNVMPHHPSLQHSTMQKYSQVFCSDISGNMHVPIRHILRLGPTPPFLDLFDLALICIQLSSRMDCIQANPNHFLESRQ